MASWQRFTLAAEYSVPLTPADPDSSNPSLQQGTLPPAPPWRRFLFEEDDFAP
jgi:hypothetical protein